MPQEYPPLKSLHPEGGLIQVKLATIDKLTTEVLIGSLRPGQPHCLKTRPDGTVLDGHHRIYVLRKRGVVVDTLPREIIEKESYET
jgi:hypothetical protein